MISRTRLVPDEPFPPYSYVYGAFPHPLSDPSGHSFGKGVCAQTEFDPNNWQACRSYRFAIDLFNHGYYWEAHEVWEGLWNSAGRRGPAADFFKGLIKLAAAGVKARQKLEAGVRGHAQRASELFQQVLRATGSESCMGLRLPELIARATELNDLPKISRHDEPPKVEIIFDWEIECPA